MEKPKNLYVRPKDMKLRGGGNAEGNGDTRWEVGIKGRKKWDNSNSIINKIYQKNKIKCQRLKRES